MSRFARIMLLGAIAAVFWPTMVQAQYNSELVGFNGPPINDETAHEMFRIPEWSGSSADHVINNTSGAYDYNNAFRASGLHTEGTAALQSFFYWVDSSDPEAWVRLTTFGAAERPNPSLHTQGKVRFKLTNRSELIRGEIGICLGIRETGVIAPQLGDGGTSGDIEWVGVTDVILDPNDPNVAIAPVPAITLPVAPTAYVLEWNLATGVVTVNGTPQGGTIMAFTGDGVLNAPNNRGTLEHIAITNLTSDSAALIDFAIDELQFESPEPDPVLPPTVVWPIIADDTEVTVTDLMATVDMVMLYRDGTPIVTVPVTDPNDLIITIDPAQTGEIYTATQRDSVTSTFSDQSAGVEVLPEPPAYTFSILLDETGDGSCDTGWEWVGVTATDGFTPTGQPIFTSDGIWQTIDIPLDDDSLVLPSYGGNGELDPGPEGVWTMDSIWFNLTSESVPGPWEIFIDSVQYIDEFGQPGEVILDMEDGINRLQYARGQSPDELGLISSALSTQTSFDGGTSHRLVWEGNGVQPECIGMLQRIAYNCGTSAEFPDTATALRFHMVLRAQPTAPDIALPEIVGPIVVGTQDTVRVLNDATATSIQLYIDGEAYGPAVTPTGTETDFSGLTLSPGESVSATQTLPAGDSDLAYPRAVIELPEPPTIQIPIIPGGNEVTVVDVYDAPFATADLVTVYIGGVEHGSAIPAGDTVIVTLDTTLANGDVVTATQTVNGVESDPSVAVTVGFPTPVFYMAPPADAVTVRLMNLYGGVDTVTITVNDTTDFTASVPAGAAYVDVPVSGLVAGDVLTSYQSLGAINSELSDPEIVTVSAPVSIIDDDFEGYADQAALESVWTQGGDPAAVLSADMNATCPTGLQSVLTPTGASYMTQAIAELTPTATEPVVMNVNIYDPVGVDPAGLVVQWAELSHLGGSGTSMYIHIGMLGWANTDNVHYDMRVLGHGGPNWVDLDDFDGPERSIGWHTFTVVHKGGFLDAYVDGLLAKKNIPLSEDPPVLYARADIGGGYASSVDVYFDDFIVETGPVTFGCIEDQPPAEPLIRAPILDGEQTIYLENVDLDVTNVTIYDDTPMVIGTYSGPIDPNAPLEVTLLRPLVHLESIYATVTNAAGSTDSGTLEVGNGNGDIMVCIGIRETGEDLPLGSEGSSSWTFPLEWIGANSVVEGAPQGTPISPSNAWQTLVFDPATDPITAFTGDGVIDGTRGTLEHLAITVDAASDARSSGTYYVYIDNVINVGADGGSDFVIADFEGFDVGTEVLFQEPTFSGSTDEHLAPLPSASEITDLEGNPGQSELVAWFWNDTTAQRWIRLTTASAIEIPSPIIDLTKPIQFDILLLDSDAGCPNPGSSGNYCTADIANADCQVNLSDLAQLLGHYGETGGVTHDDGDLDGDGDVDLSDLAELLGQYGDDCN